MSDEVTFEAAPIDSDEARPLMEALFGEFDRLYPPEDIARVLATEAKAGKDFDGVFLLAWKGGEAVGCGGVRRLDDEGTGELKRIYLAPDARGVGVARKLVSRLETEAVKLGLSSMVLTTAPLLAAAVRLYESMGYERIENYDPWGEVEFIISYRKQLA